jgi:hypothetical protein
MQALLARSIIQLPGRALQAHDCMRDASAYDSAWRPGYNRCMAATSRFLPHGSPHHAVVRLTSGAHILIDERREGSAMSGIGERIIRAMRLDVTLYEEVESDVNAMSQAMLVVVLASVAGGLANMSASGQSAGFIGGALGALLGWYVWAFLTYYIGTRVLPGANTHADIGQLLRTIGFAASPGLVQVVGIIPALAELSIAVANVWTLIATVVAVRQALDYESTGRAIAVCVVGWLAQIAVVAVVLLFLVGTVWSLAGGLPSKPSF